MSCAETKFRRRNQLFFLVFFSSTACSTHTHMKSWSEEEEQKWAYAIANNNTLWWPNFSLFTSFLIFVDLHISHFFLLYILFCALSLLFDEKLANGCRAKRIYSQMRRFLFFHIDRLAFCERCVSGPVNAHNNCTRRRLVCVGRAIFSAAIDSNTDNVSFDLNYCSLCSIFVVGKSIHYF